MKILMAAMSLGIGGAETHIIELSCALKKRGYDVSVVSNGGVYEKALNEAGIKHYTLPLHTKRPDCVLKAYIGLRKLIKREKFDIVHAHARIPAFLCGLLAKRLKFHFVVTCHGVYEITPFWKKLAEWGDRSIAVSCDTKDYLIREYGVFPDNITLTVNGINTDRFSQDADGGNVLSEFGLDTSSRHRILYVSRIDRESAHVAFMLISIMPALLEKYPDAELVIVGGGSAFEELRGKADALNFSLANPSRRAVILTGSRTDVEHFISACDVFVGVSRSLLEAMAAQKPVIIAGSQGYLGYFEPSLLHRAVETNFCARGCELPTPEKLLDAVIRTFSMTREQVQLIGSYNRSIVCSEYSVERMTSDALKVYEKLLPLKPYRHGEAVLSGYYGYGNSGDDLLLQTIIKDLRGHEPSLRITVLSHRPKLTARTYGVRSINRFNLLSVANELRHAKLLISGGGTLLTTNTSTRSLLYYYMILGMAKKLGAKTMIYGSGIGPVKGSANRKRVVKAVTQADAVTLREAQSLNELKSMGCKVDKVKVTADPAFLLNMPNGEWADYIVKREGLTEGRGYFALALRPWKDAPANFEERIIRLCRLITEKHGLVPVFAAMQRSVDLEMSARIADTCSGILLSDLCASELASVFAKCSFVVGMRLHSLIYSLVAGTPVIALSYDPKIDALAEAAGIEAVFPIADMDPGKLASAADSVISSPAEYKKTVSSLKELAVLNSTIAVELTR